MNLLEVTPSEEVGKPKQSQLYRRLDREWKARGEWASDEIDDLVGIWEGTLPGRFNHLLPAGQELVINTIKKAWGDYTGLLGRIPELKSKPENQAQPEAKRTAKHEAIAYGYLQSAPMNWELLLRHIAWWLVGTGRAVVIVEPDFQKRMPAIVPYDPRLCRPKFSRTVGSGWPVSVQDIIVRRVVNRSELQHLGLRDTQGPSTQPERDTAVVYHYIDDKQWIVATTGSQSVSEHGLGECPAWTFITEPGDRVSGPSLFKDQIPLMVNVTRLMEFKMQSAEQSVYPMYWVKGTSEQLELGPGVINYLDADGEMGRLDPPQTLQVDRDIDQAMALMRILNRNPEARQGEVSTSGYVSAKSIDQLSHAATDTTLSEYQAILADGYRRIFAMCFNMDEVLWPNEKKTIDPLIYGTTKTFSYVPSRHIKGYRSIYVGYGFGSPGYEGHLQKMQAMAAGVMSKRQVIESIPGQHDAEKVMREIWLEQMSDAAFQHFRSQAEKGQLDMLLWAKIHKKMAETGISLWEAMVEYQEELQEQAQAASQEGSQVGALTAPPQEQGFGPPTLPGLPPGLVPPQNGNAPLGLPGGGGPPRALPPGGSPAGSPQAGGPGGEQIPPELVQALAGAGGR